MIRELKAGDVFLKYRIRSVLGQGGMGVVYEATDEYSDDVVAIKLLTSLRPDFAQRFREECKLYPKLHHPNIVRMRDAGVTDAGTAYIIMDRLKGKTVRRMADRMRRLDFLNAFHLMLQVADAMQFVHSRGIWHRDLKPENFMVGAEGLERGHLWVLDFGIAKRNGAPSTDTLPEVGTVRYLSPEQARGQKPDGRADLYAFGVIFYELLTGRHTVVDDTDEMTAAEMLNAHLRGSLPPPPHELVPDCPDTAWPLIVACLEKDPADRIPTFEAVGSWLREMIRASVPPDHVLAKRVRREQQAKERRTAFDSIHEMPDHDVREDDEITVEKPARVAALAPTDVVPVAASGDRMTAPLVGFVAATSVLPFTRARAGASVIGRGKGATEPLPPRPFAPPAEVPLKRPAPATVALPRTPTTPTAATTPTEMALPRRPTEWSHRQALILAPLIGILLALAATVVIMSVQTSRASRPAEAIAAPAPSDSAPEPAAITLSAEPVAVAAPAPEPAPTIAPTAAPPIAPAPSAKASAPVRKPIAKAPAPRASTGAPVPVETGPLEPLFQTAEERATKPKGKH